VVTVAIDEVQLEDVLEEQLCLVFRDLTQGNLVSSEDRHKLLELLVEAQLVDLLQFDKVLGFGYHVGNVRGYRKEFRIASYEDL